MAQTDGPPRRMKTADPNRHPYPTRYLRTRHQIARFLSRAKRPPAICVIFALTSPTPALSQTKPAIPFNSADCKAETGGKMAVALFRVVFAFPATSEISGDANYMIVYTGPERTPTELYAPRPLPPDPAEPEGCPGHPAQRFNYGLDGPALAKLLGPSPPGGRTEQQRLSDHVGLSVMQDESAGTVLPPANPPRDAQGHRIPPPPPSIGGEPPNLPRYRTGGLCIADDPAAWQFATGLACNCDVPGAVNHIGSSPTGTPRQARMWQAPEISFRCSRGCSVRTILQPGIFLSFTHFLNPTLPKSPCWQMATYQKALFAGLKKAEIPRYPWIAQPPKP